MAMKMTAMQRRCKHRTLQIKTERDQCSWVQCCICEKRGPKKHTYWLALIAWIMALGNQHPRPKRAANDAFYNMHTPPKHRI